MDQIKFTALLDEADEVRGLLRRHLPTGIGFAERRSWWFWVQFAVTGPPVALERLQRSMDDRDTEKMVQDAW